ncbi:MAG TPA: SDR family NAD(P)-dependent oxidoreductase [Dehalococcoidia bacterium]|nr:SDR family NAD(P)-dependent oxidoreductase [Dehalococcoidia bacterium]
MNRNWHSGNGQRPTILVTGAAGFIGSHLVERLVGEGRRVVCVDNFDPYYDEEVKRANIAPTLGSGLATLVEADIRDRQALAAAFATSGPEVVVHLAARPGVRHSLEDPLPYLDINVWGTFNVLDLAREFGAAKVVFGSTSSVYGLLEDGPAREDATPCRPLSPYGASKVAAEALCSSFAATADMDVVALRFFTVYGPRQRPDMAIHRFARFILADRELPIYGDGSARRDFTYVADIVDGIVAAIDASLLGYHVFNLGQGRPVPLSQVVDLLEEALGRKARRQFHPPPAGEPPLTWADISKAEASLGYRPRTPVEEGVRAFARWLLDQGW